MHKGILLIFFSWLVYSSAASAAENQMIFLGNIEFSYIKENSNEDFELRLFLKEKAGLLKHLAEERSYHVINEREYLAIKNRQYSFPRDRDYSNREPSFINDFDAELFKPLREEIIKKYGETPSPDELTRYVNNYITAKNFNRGFDIASVVARKKEGDCTEHAVLLVSLMRMFNIPARLAIGIKIYRKDDLILAVGHAWVEYILGGKWKGADPSLLTAVDHSYIPLGNLEREGLDYTIGMITLFNRLPVRIEGSGF